MSFGRAASTSALVFVGCAVCCRIYRDQPGAGEAAAASEAPADTPAGAPEPLEDGEAVVAQRPAADALNLWVLNRPKGELVSRGVGGSDRAAVERTAEHPKPTALVVVGVGEAPECSRWYAGRAVDALAAGIAPLRVVASVLDSGRRWRWPGTKGTMSGMVRSSRGAFGGVQSVAASSFSASALEAAAARQVLIDGQNPRGMSSVSRAQRGYEPGAGIPPCDITPAPALGGPFGLLIRTASGAFFGGVVSLDVPADAGVVSVMAEYGVTLAVGKRGGVLMASECPGLAPDRIAERVYASSDWASATAQADEPGRCGTGHALLTAERAWATTGSPLSWAVAEVDSTPMSEVDAGAGGGGPTVQP